MSRLELSLWVRYRVALIFVICLSACWVGCHSQRDSLQLSSSIDTLIADGASSIEILVTAKSVSVKPEDLHVAVSGGNRYARVISVTTAGRQARVHIIAGIVPGSFRVVVTSPRFRAASLSLRSTPALGDRYSDGTPDFLRLDDPADRDAFRRWFTFLAEFESVLPRPARAAEITDCAALLRFCYREALSAHDARWLLRLGLEDVPPIPAVSKYRVPLTPLGPAIFRVASGPFGAGDLKSPRSFGQFADAHTLQTRNCYRLTDAIRQMRPGDLLFYHQANRLSPYHSMIYVGTSSFNAPGDDWLVYDTGPALDGNSRTDGEIRRVRLRELLVHPDPRWRPVSANSAFSGVYRWNILRQGQ